MLTINDTFKSRQELLEALTKHISEEKYSYYLKETQKHIKLVCKGKQAFYCEAQIIAIHKKRESSFHIKRIKPQHKCPMSYHSDKNFLKNEFSKVKEYNSIQDLMDKLPIRVSYLQAWKVLNNKNDTTFQIRERNADDFRIDYMENNQGFYLEEDSDFCDEKPHTHTEALITLKKEFLEKNPNCISFISGILKEEEINEENNNNKNEKIKRIRKENKIDLNSNDATIYFGFPKTFNLLRNIIDIKIYLRNKGCVIYGNGYDPFDKPIIISVLISEMEIGESLEIFFKFEKELRKSFNNEVYYFCDFDPLLLQKLKDLEINYFIKTRSLVKRFGKEDVEKYFKALNYEKNELLELKDYNPKNYLTLLNPTFYGLNNFGEMDVEYIFYSVYNTTFIDCVLAILKFTSDYYNELILKSSESSFGNNVLFRVEKNVKMKRSDSHEVDLENMTCTCGRYQLLLIPCVHACAVTNEPFKHVSSLYNMEIMQGLEPIKPVFELFTKFQADRFLLRRGPGRPKKVLTSNEKK